METILVSRRGSRAYPRNNGHEEGIHPGKEASHYSYTDSNTHIHIKGQISV